MKFQIHTSDELIDLFRKRPCQGQIPEEASIIFLSSDANYSPEISKHPFLKYILEYQRDGIAFWKKYGCHHPFMLCDYPFNRNKGGVPFHRNFCRLGLRPPEKYAAHISFLELLNVPTIGNKSEDKQAFADLVCLNHLQYIDNLILGGGHKLFFISKGVLKDIKKIIKNHKKIRKSNSLFAWADAATEAENQFTTKINGNKIKEIYHFSSTEIHSQIGEIKADIDEWLESTDDQDNAK